ncbi:LysR family transcriptional regulator [Salmonella enterica subsp. enterica serovar Choleraesuis]|nr:LysR family transcriptional regulator [Salmonella enterica subsp. enterica serovar Choleraesuis]
MHITLRQLAVFNEVLKSGSTTQAAQKMALSQSAVSSALAELESQLEVRLFDRVGKRLVINEYGRLLSTRAVALLEQAEDIEQMFREKMGAIRVSASSTIGNYILPAGLARFHERFPQLPLEINVGNTLDVMTAVLNFDVDVGLIEGPSHHNELITEPFMDDELIVFAAPDSALFSAPVTLKRLSEFQWILREVGSGTREIVDYLLLSKLPRINVAMELGNSEAIKYTVMHGLGISCLSRRVVAEQLASGSLREVPLPLPPLIRTLYCIHHRQKHLSEILGHFLECCKH